MAVILKLGLPIVQEWRIKGEETAGRGKRIKCALYTPPSAGPPSPSPEHDHFPFLKNGMGFTPYRVQCNLQASKILL